MDSTLDTNENNEKVYPVANVLSFVTDEEASNRVVTRKKETKKPSSNIKITDDKNDMDTKTTAVFQGNDSTADPVQTISATISKNNLPPSISIPLNSKNIEDKSVISPSSIGIHGSSEISKQTPPVIITPQHGSSLVSTQLPQHSTNNGTTAQSITEARGDRKNIELFRGAFFLSCSMIIQLLLLALAMALPLTEFIVGIKYVNGCSIDQRIPIYLIVSGATVFPIIAIWIFKIIMLGCAASPIARSMEIPCGVCAICQIVISVLLAIFSFVWLIIGTVWIVNTKKYVQFNDNLFHPETYCAKTVFDCALASIIIRWILLGIGCLCSCRCLPLNQTSNDFSMSFFD